MANEWDRVPWMMGGGNPGDPPIQHSVNVARLLAYVAFGGDEGIIGPGDLRVLAATVPNGTVKVQPGACAVLNRGLNVNYEAYAARLPLVDTVSITPTGSGGGRSDLIVAIVMNPYQTGEPWPDPSPSSITNGTAEFVKTMVIPNVPAATRTVAELNLGYSAIALARIDIPANTGTITQAMITDLRQMSSVRQKSVTKASHVTATTTLSGAFAYFPSEALTTVEVPEWANVAFVKGQIGAVHRDAGNMWVDFKMDLRLGGTIVQSPVTSLDLYSGDADRNTLVVGGARLDIPAALRGKEATFGILGKNNAAVVVRTDAGSASYDITITFGQEPGSSE